MRLGQLFRRPMCMFGDPMDKPLCQNNISRVFRDCQLFSRSAFTAGERSQRVYPLYKAAERSRLAKRPPQGSLLIRKTPAPSTGVTNQTKFLLRETMRLVYIGNWDRV